MLYFTYFLEVVNLKFLRKTTIVLALLSMTCFSFQSVEAFPKPVPTVGTYKPIPNNISINKGSELDLKLQPGFDVTLLMSETVHFRWDTKNAKTFMIKDNTGKKVFQQYIGNQNHSIDVNLSQINLEAGKKYSWSVDGNNKVYSFTILDSDTEKELLKKFAEIEKSFSSNDERLLKKASYAQMLSDDPEYKLDLYWLSYQWLSQISPNNTALEKETWYLLYECNIHYLAAKGRHR